MESVNASHGRSNSRSRIGAAVNPNTVDLQFNSKLPKLDFLVFKGNPVDWTTVWDQFKTSIHLNSRHRQGQLFEKVFRWASFFCDIGIDSEFGKLPRSSRYLKNRFGNTQTLISAHMETLLNVNKVRNFDDTIALRKLYNYAETCMRNLKTLNVETVTYGYLFIRILKARLLVALVIIIAKKFGDIIWALDLVLKYFYEELIAKEACFSYKRFPEKEEGHKREDTL